MGGGRQRVVRHQPSALRYSRFIHTGLGWRRAMASTKTSGILQAKACPPAPAPTAGNGASPAADLHAIDPPGKSAGIQRGSRRSALCRSSTTNAHGDRVLGRQLARQPPAHADVTEVVHHGTEQVPGRRRQGRGSDDANRRQDWGQTRRKACTDCFKALFQGEAEFHQQSPHALPSFVDSFLFNQPNDKYFLCYPQKHQGNKQWFIIYINKNQWQSNLYANLKPVCALSTERWDKGCYRSADLLDFIDLDGNRPDRQRRNQLRKPKPPRWPRSFCGLTAASTCFTKCSGPDRRGGRRPRNLRERSLQDLRLLFTEIFRFPTCCDQLLPKRSG